MSEKIKDCCKTSKRFYLMLATIVVSGILITASYNGYDDQVENILYMMFNTLLLAGVGFMMWVTYKAFGLFCGIFGMKKYESDDYDEINERGWLGLGCVGLPICLIIIFNHIASNIDWILRVYSLG